MTIGDHILLHLFYLLVTVAAITVGLLAGIVLDFQWCRNVFRPWDYLGAAIFGGDGKHSISAYCGRAMLAEGQPTAWQIVLVLLGGVINGIFGSLHCQDAARKEFA